jgi:hypothetical protein
MLLSGDAIAFVICNEVFCPTTNVIFVKRPRDIRVTLIVAKEVRDESIRNKGTPVIESIIHNSAENEYEQIIDAFNDRVIDDNMREPFTEVENARAIGEPVMKGVLPGDQVSVLPLVAFLANAPGDAREKLPISRACNIKGVIDSDPAAGSDKVPPRILFTFPKGLTG